MFEFFKRSAHKYYGESPNFHDKDHSRVILITIADKGEADRNAGTYSTGDKRLSNFGKRVAGFVTKQKYSFKTVRNNEVFQELIRKKNYSRLQFNH